MLYDFPFAIVLAMGLAKRQNGVTEKGFHRLKEAVMHWAASFC